MKTILLAIAAVVLLLVTNPSLQKHQDCINEKCKAVNPVTGLIGGCKLFAQLGCEYHNCFLFSYTMSHGEVVSIGALGIPVVVKDLNV